MRSEAEYQAASTLIAAGIVDTEVGRRLGIPRSTVRDWRVGREAESGGRTKSWSDRPRGSCFRCEGGWVDGPAYAYLLGVYLGDGYLAAHPKGVYRLRIACDLRYPCIIDEVASQIVIVRGKDMVGFATRPGCVEVMSYWKHWPCLFPQHAPGRKHERAIELVPWQSELVANHPKDLVRGLIHSDGSRHVNEIRRTSSSGTKRYRYPRYVFTNASADILSIYTNALALLRVHWTQTSTRAISVSRRSDVAFLDTFVGAKR